MVGLWRLHRHKVTKLTDIKDYADIRTAAVLVILNTIVTAFQKCDRFSKIPYIFLLNKKTG